MDKSIETFIAPGRKLFRRAEESLMKLTSHWYRQIPVANVDENAALVTSQTPLAGTSEDLEKDKSSRCSAVEVQTLPLQLQEAQDSSVFHPQQSLRRTIRRLLETKITHGRNA